MSDTGYDAVVNVRTKYGRLQSDCICECGECLAAGVDEPPILVPDHRERAEDGMWFDVGRWIHGYQLRKHIEGQRALRQAWSQFVPKVMDSRAALRRVK